MSRLLDMSRNERVFSSPMFAGIGPSRLAFRIFRIVNLERFPIEEGKRPDNSVLDRKSPPRFARFLILSGITPDMLLFAMLRNSRFTRLPMDEGMLPEIPISFK